MFSDMPTISADHDAIINRARDILDRRFVNWHVIYCESYCYLVADGIDFPSPGLVGLGWDRRRHVIDLCRKICRDAWQ